MWMTCPRVTVYMRIVVSVSLGTIKIKVGLVKVDGHLHRLVEIILTCSPHDITEKLLI
jgi:hypothetical protein